MAHDRDSGSRQGHGHSSRSQRLERQADEDRNYGPGLRGSSEGYTADYWPEPGEFDRSGRLRPEYDDRGEPRARNANPVSSWMDHQDTKFQRSLDRGDGPHRGRGPRGYVRSDERIREDVNDRLTEDSYLDASDIEISVKDGEVTLSGFVSQRTDKRRAEDVVETIVGVRHVQNNLRVR